MAHKDVKSGEAGPETRPSCPSTPPSLPSLTSTSTELFLPSSTPHSSLFLLTPSPEHLSLPSSLPHLSSSTLPVSLNPHSLPPSAYPSSHYPPNFSPFPHPTSQVFVHTQSSFFPFFHTLFPYPAYFTSSPPFFPTYTSFTFIFSLPCYHPSH